MREAYLSPGALIHISTEKLHLTPGLSHILSLDVLAISMSINDLVIRKTSPESYRHVGKVVVSGFCVLVTVLGLLVGSVGVVSPAEVEISGGGQSVGHTIDVSNCSLEIEARKLSL